MESSVTLPQANAAFRWSDETWGHGLRSTALEAVAQHVFTTRQLRLRAPAAPDIEAAAWVEAAAAVGCAVDDIHRVSQVHGATVRVVRDRDVMQTRPPADALVSDVPGIVLAIQVADCVPLLLADRRRSAAAAVHAGWRGTSARIVAQAVAALTREFGSAPADLVAAIGPSIGPCCYRVGLELVEEFRADGATEDEVARWFSHQPDGALVLDLWQANRDQLVAAGVPPGSIATAALCTRTHSTVFDSYRAEGAQAGRMAGVVAVPGERRMKNEERRTER